MKALLRLDVIIICSNISCFGLINILGPGYFHQYIFSLTNFIGKNGLSLFILKSVISFTPSIKSNSFSS